MVRTKRRVRYAILEHKDEESARMLPKGIPLSTPPTHSHMHMHMHAHAHTHTRAHTRTRTYTLLCPLTVNTPPLLPFARRQLWLPAEQPDGE